MTVEIYLCCWLTVLLLLKEMENLLLLEGLSLSSDLSQGYALKALTGTVCQNLHPGFGGWPGAKTIKKNTNSTQNKSQTHHARAYEVMSFLSTDCELSTETCSKNVYSLGPWWCLLKSPRVIHCLLFVMELSAVKLYLSYCLCLDLFSFGIARIFFFLRWLKTASDVYFVVVM